MAAVILPLAPSWAVNKSNTPTEPGQLTGAEQSTRSSDPQPGERVSRRAEATVDTRIAQEFKNDPDVAALAKQIDEVRKQLDHNKTRQCGSPIDPARASTAERQLEKINRSLRQPARTRSAMSFSPSVQRMTTRTMTIKPKRPATRSSNSRNG